MSLLAQRCPVLGKSCVMYVCLLEEKGEILALASQQRGGELSTKSQIEFPW